MNQPIVFTISDVLWLAGAIVAIASAVNVVAKAIERMRKPNKTQDERLGALEKRAKSDFERLERIEEGNVIMQRALLALLAHGIDGNDVEAMKRAKAELTDFLLER
jgi:hypothetical protein